MMNPPKRAIHQIIVNDYIIPSVGDFKIAILVVVIQFGNQ